MNARQVHLLPGDRVVLIAAVAQYRNHLIGNQVAANRARIKGLSMKPKQAKGAQSE